MEISSEDAQEAIRQEPELPAVQLAAHRDAAAGCQRWWWRWRRQRGGGEEGLGGPIVGENAGKQWGNYGKLRLFNGFQGFSSLFRRLFQPISHIVMTRLGYRRRTSASV